MAAAITSRAYRQTAFRPGYVAGRVALYALITIGCIIFALPFVWMLSTSVKAPGEVFIYPPKWIPSQWQFQHFVVPWTEVPFVAFYRNTVTVAVLDIIGTTLSSSLVAFGFARMRFRGRNLLFLVVLSTLMLPYQVTLIPQYVLFSHLHWVNTLMPLIVPTYFGSAFNIFLLRQFMMTIPTEIDDAARIDGAGWRSIYARMLIPLSLPALGVVAIFEFTFRWNDFLGPLIYLNTPDKFTVPLGLQMLTTQYTSDVPGTMAMTVESIIPVIIVFFLAQRYFVQGVVISGLKG
jgi:multiple sugar transport system permease protein